MAWRMFGSASGRANEPRAGAAELRHRIIDFVGWRRVEAGGFYVGDEADDLHPDVRIFAAQQGVAESGLAGKNVFRETFVDDAHAGRAVAVVGREAAALAQRDAERAKIIRAHDGEPGERALRQRQHRAADDAVRRARI